MKTFFEQHGVPEGPEQHSLASDAYSLVVNELSADSPTPAHPNRTSGAEEHVATSKEDDPPADPAADPATVIASSGDPPAEVASPRPSERRRTTARIIAAHQAALAHADESTTVVVTASATGHGTHTRWTYTDDPGDAAPPPTAAEEAPAASCNISPPAPCEPGSSNEDVTLVGASHDVDVDHQRVTTAQKDEAKVEAMTSDTSNGQSTAAKPASTKRVRVESPPPSEETPSRHTRTRSRLPSPPPPPLPPAFPLRTPIHRTPSAPFNHFPKLPRPRPRGLRREPAFYHKSHYAVAWVPEFGDYDRPPRSADEAMPAWLGRGWRGVDGSGGPVQAPSAGSGSGLRKRGRAAAEDGEGEGDGVGETETETEKGRKRPRNGSVSGRK
ncbi:hypothetical protein LshimejAT787_1201140 [Lyophyllum shimeji]|uniref:Uncharacterized protein n=1 Tax=Lyophyllum shimeji TaxID=47721 RepID=A0A9P3PV98_LYOSH|nr:hypothetical protein LshimejAT787_1201140 [Lyophyllum shimeji]